MKRYACIKCGRISDQNRCSAHRLAPRARGNAFEPTRRSVAERDAWTCQICGKPIERREDLHVDHVVPRAAGGGDEAANLAATHRWCNLRKGTSERP